ncbi:MAG: hypothetical protein R3C44_05190 [Chloroflexota bacterium]
MRLPGDDVPLTLPEVAESANVVFGETATLVGFTVDDGPVTAADSIPLTLVWQSLSDDIGTDYIVFVHLVDAQGQLLGQHDGVPGDGRRPTSDWLAGDYIVDPHTLTFRDPGYEGPAYIMVGLYDPSTGGRLLIENGADAFSLPVELQVIPSTP